MKVLICGCRWFTMYNSAFASISHLLQNIEVTEIVSGGAKGADELGERYAKEMNIPITRFNADWNTYGKSAGPIRNQYMAEYADLCIAFWDGKSRGTLDMINRAKKAGILIRIVKI